MADSIIVLDRTTKTAKTQTSDVLTTMDIMPSTFESFENEAKSYDAMVSSKKSTSEKANNAVDGASQEDLKDLARRTGDSSLYLYYYQAIGLPRTLGACFILAVFTFTANFPRFWLQWYTDDPVPRFPIFIGVYLMLVVVASLSLGAMIWLVNSVKIRPFFITLSTNFDRQIMISIVPKSGAELHKILLRTVMHAPMQFLSIVDSGIILNQFSQDMTLIDAVLPTVAFGTYLGRSRHDSYVNLTNSIALIQCVAQLILVALGSSYMAICIPVAIFALYLIQKVYLRTSRQLRFLDLEARSPLFTHFVETIEGLDTIRSFHWQAHFIEINLKCLDQSQKPYYLLLCIQRWLILVLDLMVAAIATILVALAFSLRNTTSSDSLGVALTAILSFSQALQDLILSWTQMETSLGAIARTKNLESAVSPEDANDDKVQQPQSGWPGEGSIEFHDVSVSYE